ncbi:MAG: hypothetical protein ABEI99_08040 [Halobaculum sp.]
MPTIDEKRVYDDKTDTTRALVASGVGVVAVSVSGDIVGEFGIEQQCSARDVAAHDGVLAVATDEDVLVGDYAATDHGPAVAVGVHDGSVLAAAPDGTVSRLADTDDPSWESLGTVMDPRAIDGDLIAAADGVHRVVGDDLSAAGLDDVRDVTTRAIPHAATADGLYSLGNGWQEDRDGSFRAVETDAVRTAGATNGECVAAATGDAVLTREGPWGESGSEPPDGASGETGDDWQEHDESGVVALAIADDLLLGVTDGGVVRVTVGDGWRGRTLGVPEVSAVTILAGSE